MKIIKSFLIIKNKLLKKSIFYLIIIKNIYILIIYIFF